MPNLHQYANTMSKYNWILQNPDRESSSLSLCCANLPTRSFSGLLFIQPFLESLSWIKILISELLSDHYYADTLLCQYVILQNPDRESSSLSLCCANLPMRSFSGLLFIQPFLESLSWIKILISELLSDHYYADTLLCQYVIALGLLPGTASCPCLRSTFTTTI